ncbi:hypothetical protein PF617_gp15 [Salmonella phage St162]|uniref:Uncharacterized protein n=1 Tax=Salmonella phage St162 TaxID=2024312 RepID=A0A291AX97_9CAUD|nr:hypothetical protein PF617_gp15 [Salmonella phage St162]ATE85600.1 hypothetical protein St162_gp15 [Salmonella phage St162]
MGERIMDFLILAFALYGVVSFAVEKQKRKDEE